MNKFLVLLGIICVASLFSSNYSLAKTFDPVSEAKWSCPPVNANNPPDAETDWGSTGDRLYIRIVDTAGNDIEIWCIDGWSWKWYYQMEISFPNGDHTVLSECEITGGSNKHLVVYDGNLDMVPTLSGSKLAVINGTILTYLHENFNVFKDHHNFYNFTSGIAQRVDTQKFFNGTTKIIDTTEKKVDTSDPPWSLFAFSGDFGDLNESELMGDETSVCSNVEFDEEIISLEEISILVGDTPTTFELFYPTDAGIQATMFDEEKKSLTISLENMDLDERFLSISIPRDLLDHTQAESFTISGNVKNAILFEESTTETYRTLNMDIPTDTESIIITGSEVFKELPVQSQDVFDVFAPKKQFMLGVSPEKIICNEGLELIFKPTSESPACVTTDTAQKLLERNWLPRLILS